MESESFEEFQKRIDDLLDNRPPLTDKDDRRDLLAMLPAIVEAGDLAILLYVRRRLRELAARNRSQESPLRPT